MSSLLRHNGEPGIETCRFATARAKAEFGPGNFSKVRKTQVPAALYGEQLLATEGLEGVFSELRKFLRNEKNLRARRLTTGEHR